LLKGYKIRSVRNEAGQQRGFYANPFGEAWKRVLKLDIPDGLDGIDILCKMGTPLTTPPPILQNPSNTSSPSNPGASAMPSSAEAPTPLPSTITKKENMQTELQLPNTPAEWDELKERVLVRHSMLPEYVEKREQEEHGVSSDISNF
jgi:hypothetical protein